MASICPVDEVICVGVVLKSRGFVVKKTSGRILLQPYISPEDLGQLALVPPNLGFFFCIKLGY